MHRLNILYGKLNKAQKTGPLSMVACCPVHKDSTPSLSVSIVDGKVLAKCHAGCSQDAVYEAIKLMLPEETKDQDPITWELKQTYVYKTPNHQPALRVQRFETPGGQKKFSQYHMDNGTWKPGRGQGRIAPYNYALWEQENAVYFVEGEKCADALTDLMIPATCIPGGVNGWKEEYSQYFAGKKVYIFPDNDVVGKKFAEHVKNQIQTVAKKVLIVPLTLENEGDDVFDYLKTHSKDELLSECHKLENEIPLKSNFLTGEESRKILTQTGSKLLNTGMRMLDDAFGGLCDTDLLVVSGASGFGKTAICTNIALNVAKQKKRVFFFALEARKNEIELRMRYQLLADKYFNDPQKTVRKHVAWREYIHGDREVLESLEKYEKAVDSDLAKFKNNFFSFYRDHSNFTIQDFENKFLDVKDHVDLIVIDHLNYFDSHDEKKNENKQVEEIVKRIRDCVLLARVPVILVVHVRKKDTKQKKIIEDMEDLHGSSNIYKIATKVMIVGQQPKTDSDNAFETNTIIRIPKDRDGDVAKNYLFRCKFDIRTRTYSDKYELGYMTTDGQNFEPANKTPYWYTGKDNEHSPI